ncbi:MAG TPA: TIGR01777 family oxidoreductase [Bryobacteraceae bacterium]|jgi:uncharacterized protein (TIGR01777 family)|nr:TIGR01777 family oxidoreductase [Bryobacteraceae bacterium]
MTYLVTGATGFIGRKLVRALLDRGDAVYYLARKRNAGMPSQASFHPWDMSRPPELNALSRIDGIFHLAGESIAQRWNAEVKKRIYETRVEGTRHLVAAVARLQHKPRVLVSASAVGYYGNRGDELLDESAAPGDDFLAVLCRDWEDAALSARDVGLRAVPVRIATVLGREGGALPAMLKPFRLGLGGRFGTGKQWVSWIHIGDLVRLLLFAVDTETVKGAINGTSPQPVTNAEFTKALSRVLHRPAPFVIPKFALKLVMGELADFVFDSQRVVPKAAVEAGFQYEFPELDNALADLLGSVASAGIHAS